MVIQYSIAITGTRRAGREGKRGSGRWRGGSELNNGQRNGGRRDVVIDAASGRKRNRCTGSARWDCGGSDITSAVSEKTGEQAGGCVWAESLCLGREGESGTRCENDGHRGTVTVLVMMASGIGRVRRV